jgi:hypothetical protein
MAIQARGTRHGICATPIAHRGRVDIVIGWLCDEEGRMKRAQRNARGCVRLDRRRGTWNYLYDDQGKRRSRLIGNRQQYPTKATAWKAAEAFRSSLQPINRSTAPTVQTLVNQFREENAHGSLTSRGLGITSYWRGVIAASQIYRLVQ